MVETERATYTHDTEAVDEVAAELQDGVRCMVQCNLESVTWEQLQWSKAGFPTLTDVVSLASDAVFRVLRDEQRRQLLHDESAQTAVERGDGLIPAVRVKTGGQRLPTLQQLADTFDECIGPAKLEASTRGGYQAAWRTVLTWGIAHDSVHLLLPMTQATLKALTLELLMVGCAAGTIKNVWCSIEDRHRRFGLPLPLGVAGDFRRLYKAVCAVRRAPSRICFPIGPHHVKQLLDLVGLTRAQLRDVLMCVTGVVLSCRVVELVFLQICDFLWDRDGAYHPRYLGTAAVRIYRRKQDTSGTGHYPRLGVATHDEWDIVQRLRRYAEQQGLQVSAECTKQKSPGARCRKCSPFFLSEAGKTQRAPRQGVSRQQVTNGVVKSLQLIGVDTTHFSGMSMRIGGLSASFSARIPREVMHLQSGHEDPSAMEGYMRPEDPSVWYDSFAAFKL